MRAIIMSAAGLLVMLTFAGSATAQDVNHAIDFTKTCTSPTKIGDPYACSYMVLNDVDAAQDTLTVTGLRDVVHRAGGDVDSGNVFGTLQIDNCTTASGACTQSAATCTGATLFGTGTRVNPWVGAASCTLPYGSQLNFHFFSHYTVQPADYGLPSHILTDDAYLTWHDLCNGPVANTNCVADPADAQAKSQTVVEQLSSSTSSAIHDLAHHTVTTIEVGGIVHDFATVTGQSGQPIPTGNVTIQRFPSGSCSEAAASSTTVALAADGTVDATGFSFTASTAGVLAFQAMYLGDGTYSGSTGPCETLTVGPTAVQVASLKAARKPGGVLLRWRMGSEVGVVGYSVYRERNGARVRLNRASIAARGGVGGRSYSYLDRSAPRAHHGTRYWLQVVNLDGSRLWKAVRLR